MLLTTPLLVAALASPDLPTPRAASPEPVLAPRALDGSGTTACPAPAPDHVLDRLQREDGSWSAAGYRDSLAFGEDDPAPVAGVGRAGDDLQVTCALLLAALGDGQTTRVGPRRASIARGLAWVLSQQDERTGRFGAGEVPGHALATHLLREWSVLDPSDEVDRAAQRAVEHLLANQSEDGSWPSVPGGEADAGSTGWAALALVPVLDEAPDPARAQALARAHAWLTARAPQDLAAAAPAALLDVLAPDGERITGAELAERFSKLAERWRAQETRSPNQGALLTLVAYQAAGEAWRSWSEGYAKGVQEAQLSEGPEQGLWPASGDPRGGLWDAAWNAITLQVRFRYARLLGTR